jgi:uncharacterized protein (TIGR00296 family)
MATQEMCIYCFDALFTHFHRAPAAHPQFANDKYPLFVSWHKETKSRGEPVLRGCKGTFSPREIHKGLSEFALISALKDTRFDPVTAQEIPFLHCAVSLLTEFEMAADVFDWEIGTHGIILDFEHSGKKLNATYLPEVAHEQGWTKMETLKSLARKAGYNGPVSERSLAEMNATITRYQSSKSKLTYREYLHYKNLQV